MTAIDQAPPCPPHPQILHPRTARALNPVRPTARPWFRGLGSAGLLALAAQLRVGTLTVQLPDGSRHTFAGPQAGPRAVLVVRHPRLFRRLVIGGMLGFCEAYLDGDWLCTDLAALFELALRNRSSLDRVLAGQRWFQILQTLGHRLRPNSRAGSRRNIAAHYDLGNAFYRAWLDETMTYSAALFADLDQAEPLEPAQRRKYAAIAARLGLAPGHHLLEIGCGWGGFAAFAASECQARVTAITLSRAQHAFASDRIVALGLQDRVEVQLADYRDVSGRFDRIASIEMFEAVGESYWPAYFRALSDRLRPDGRAALQVITIDERLFPDYRRSADFIQKYVFPGGMLPTEPILRQQAAKAGLAWGGSEGYGRHYARTLALWQQRFQAAWPQLVPLGFDHRFKRLWEQYLAYCQAGFTTGSLDVLQLTLTRP